MNLEEARNPNGCCGDSACGDSTQNECEDIEISTCGEALQEMGCDRNNDACCGIGGDSQCDEDPEEECGCCDSDLKCSDENEQRREKNQIQDKEGLSGKEVEEPECDNKEQGCCSEVNYEARCGEETLEDFDDGMYMHRYIIRKLN